MSNKEIVDFLTDTSIEAGIIQKMKIRYRPYICPFDELLNYADGKKSAIDIGCGAGQFCALLANFTELQDIYGIEISDNLVHAAKEVNANSDPNKKVSFATYDGSKLPTEISKYDMVYMVDVYHHIPRELQPSYIAQLYELMKPGATFVFKDIDAGSPLVVFNKLHDFIFSKELGHEISLAKAQQLCTEAGFEIMETRKKTIAIYPHYFVIAKKPTV